jgi:hypothetical protein
MNNMVSTDGFMDMFVTAIIAVALYAPLQAFIDDAVATATGVGATLLSLIPILYVIVLIGAFAYWLKRKNK